jgi:short-subunit dehydrogenase
MQLEGAIVVVTGASAGIGRATALELARSGAHVVAAARREDRLKELAEEIDGQGGRALPVACDVADRTHVDKLKDAVTSEFGRCDALVNNAGVPGGGPFDQMSIEDIERVTRINYLGVLYCTKAFLPMMLERGRGHIVNVASLAGRYAVPGATVYTATKHAVIAFSEALYHELRPKGVLVTAVNPGLVRTEQFPHRDASDRIVMPPERIARVIADVLRTGKAPEVSVPRWLASLQAFRVLTPPLYRWGIKRASERGLRATRAGGED